MAINLNEIAEVMNALHEVSWDRCVARESSLVAFGWIIRNDGGRDFAIIRQTDDELWFATSSAKYSSEFSRRLFGEDGDHKGCDKVCDVFGDLVANRLI